MNISRAPTWLRISGLLKLTKSWIITSGVQICWKPRKIIKIYANNMYVLCIWMYTLRQSFHSYFISKYFFHLEIFNLNISLKRIIKNFYWYWLSSYISHRKSLFQIIKISTLPLLSQFSRSLFSLLISIFNIP